MKIFSNFDTKLPLLTYQKALHEYGADKVLFVRRHRIYLLLYVTLPSIAIGCVVIASFFVWQMFASLYIANIIFTVLFGLLSLMALFRIIINYVNYLLDFTVITPRLITSYNQTGIFKRQARTIDTDKIKAITVSGKSIWQSVFNYGSVVFLSEGDDDDYGDIVLHFLKNPNALKDEVIRVIELAKDE